MSDGTFLRLSGRAYGRHYDVRHQHSREHGVQDFLNVRNWRTSAADLSTYTDELTYNLNDGQSR